MAAIARVCVTTQPFGWVLKTAINHPIILECNPAFREECRSVSFQKKERKNKPHDKLVLVS